MIDQAEAGERARQLVEQYITDAGPECEHDYLKLLVKLAAAVNATMLNYTGPIEPWVQMNDALDGYADVWRQSPPMVH